MEWIKLSELKPEEYEPVLFYVPKADENDRDVFTGYMRCNGRCAIFGLIGNDREHDFLSRVTHWQPLPAPPVTKDRYGNPLKKEKEMERTGNSNNEMLLRCLQNAKEDGIDTVLMTSTNRVVGTVEEMDKVREAYEASGVAIETLDGSHLFPQGRDMVNATCLSSDEE